MQQDIPELSILDGLTLDAWLGKHYASMTLSRREYLTSSSTKYTMLENERMPKSRNSARSPCPQV